MYRVTVGTRFGGEFYDECFDTPDWESALAAASELIQAESACDLGDPEPRLPCEGYQWIGQSLRYCDRCSLPYWEHTHEEVLARDSMPGPLRGPAMWKRVPIDPGQAAAAREKWDR